MFIDFEWFLKLSELLDNFSAEFAHAVDKHTFYEPYEHPPSSTAPGTTSKYFACTRARSEIQIFLDEFSDPSLGSQITNLTDFEGDFTGVHGF